jgi:tetratricopeptide (TPR) repeat protein
MRGDILSELAGLSAVAVLRLDMGDFPGAKVLFDHVESRLSSSPNLDWIWQITLRSRGLFRALQGNWSSALAPVNQVLKNTEVGKNRKHLFNLAMFTLLPVSLEVDRFYERQNWMQIEATLRKVLDIPGEKLNPAAYSLMSMVFSRQGDLDKAEQWLLEARQRTQASLIFANQRYLKRAKIELAVAKKEWTTAVNALENYIEFIEQGGFRWEHARALLEWGDVCVARRAVGDEDKARKLYHQSLEMFSDMGADGYIRVVRKRLEQLQTDGNVSVGIFGNNKA